MDIIEANRYCLIIKKAEELLVLLNDDFGSANMQGVIAHYYLLLSRHNEAHLCTVNKTPREVGSFWSTAKKIIRANSDRYRKGIFDNWCQFHQLVNRTQFSEELIDAYILFNRKYPSYLRTELGRVLLETFRIKIISEFEAHNRDSLFSVTDVS